MKPLVKIVVADEKYRPLAESLLTRTDGRTIYQGRNRVYRLNYLGDDVVVKAFKRPGAINSLVYTRLRKSKARRSYENAQRLIELGFNTPEPVAYVEVTRRGRLCESFYVSRYVEAAEIRHWELIPDNDNLLAALAQEMLRLHRAGVWVKDFSPGNILFRRDADGTYRFWLVDLNRMKFNVFSQRTLMHNFRCIHLDPAETERLARHYAHAASLDPDATARLAHNELHSYLHKKSILRRLKNLLQP